MPKNLITTTSAEIYLDEYNKTYFVNSEAGRITMREDLLAMDMEDTYNQILSVWGDVPTVTESIATLRQKKLAELASSFDIRVKGAFTTSQGYLMQFDTSDSIKMTGAIQLMETTGATEGYLTQANDATIYHVPLDVMKAVLVEMLSAYAACHAHKQELRTAISSALSAEELEAITISWPV